MTLDFNMVEKCVTLELKFTTPLVTQVSAEVLHKEGIQRSWHLWIYACLNLANFLRELFDAPIAT